MGAGAAGAAGPLCAAAVSATSISPTAANTAKGFI
jgi:hypothetical protein